MTVYKRLGDYIELVYSDDSKSQSVIRISDSTISRDKQGVEQLSEKGQHIEITLPENNNQIFASRYKTVIPDKQTFIELLEGKK